MTNRVESDSKVRVFTSPTVNVIGTLSKSLSDLGMSLISHTVSSRNSKGDLAIGPTDGDFFESDLHNRKTITKDVGLINGTSLEHQDL